MPFLLRTLLLVAASGFVAMTLASLLAGMIATSLMRTNETYYAAVSPTGVGALAALSALGFALLLGLLQRLRCQRCARWAPLLGGTITGLVFLIAPPSFSAIASSLPAPQLTMLVLAFFWGALWAGGSTDWLLHGFAARPPAR